MNTAQCREMLICRGARHEWHKYRMGSGWDEYPRHSMVAQWHRIGGLAMNTHSNLRIINITIATFLVYGSPTLGADFLAKAGKPWGRKQWTVEGLGKA